MHYQLTVTAHNQLLIIRNNKKNRNRNKLKAVISAFKNVYTPIIQKYKKKSENKKKKRERRTLVAGLCMKFLLLLLLFYCLK